MVKRPPTDLTKVAIAALPTPEKHSTPYRTTFPGLYVRVTAKGHRSWWYVHGGNWSKLGNFPEMSPRIARTRAEAAVAARVSGEPEEEEPVTRIPFGELWEEYRAAYSRGATKGGGKSLPTLESMWRVHLKRWGSRPLDQILKADVRRLRDRIADTRSNGLANHMIKTGRAMYAFALRELDYDGLNPFTQVEKLPEKRGRRRRLRQKEISAFFAALEGVTPSMRDFFKCCLFIGARAGNVKAMRWTDLDLDEGAWLIPDTKSGEAQELALGEVVVELLKARRESVNGEWVFPSRSKSGHLDTYRKAWLQVCDWAGIKGFRVHDLRRSLSSWAQEVNVPLATIQAQLGHLDPKTTLKHYTAIAGEERRAAIDHTIEAMISAAKSETKH